MRMLSASKKQRCCENVAFSSDRVFR